MDYSLWSLDSSESSGESFDSLDKGSEKNKTFYCFVFLFVDEFLKIYRKLTFEAVSHCQWQLAENKLRNWNFEKFFLSIEFLKMNLNIEIPEDYNGSDPQR